MDETLQAWIDQQLGTAPPAAVEFIKDALARRHRQAQCGRLSAMLNKQRKELAVRQAIGVLSPAARALGQRNLTNQVMRWMARQGAAFWGLKRVPDERLIRRVVTAVLTEEAQKEAHNDSFEHEAGTQDLGELGGPNHARASSTPRPPR